MLGFEIDRDILRPWTTLSNEEINTLAKWAYISFYTRPVYLFGQVLHVKSWGELKRKVMAFISMLFKQENISREDKQFSAFNENSAVMVEAARQRLRLLAQGENR
ncbi:MAG: hypothetical protein WCI27_08850 [Candidatus Omnitrophota bacterium]